MLRYLLFEMFGLSLTAFFIADKAFEEEAVEQSDFEEEKIFRLRYIFRASCRLIR